MEIYPHNDYAKYVKYQRNLTMKKTDHGKRVRSWIDEIGIAKVNNLIHEHVESVKRIVCHGCRSGFEVDQLKQLNPEAFIFGTDLYEEGYSYDTTFFKVMDFDQVPKEWQGLFDVVYSNSIDHSRDPIKTLLAWKSELKDGGIIFVSFYWGRGPSKEDCFQLDRERPINEIDEIAEKIQMKIVYRSPLYVDQYRNNVVDIIFKKG